MEWTSFNKPEKQRGPKKITATLKIPVQEPVIITVGEIKMPKDPVNFCLSCGDGIPINKSFCSEGCEYNFYDESDFERVPTGE